ncbi:MAG: hypothetical protein JWO13_1206 [Acidobacteriales bacterium]|nr:hypothetical protein [Terriglobales bacterium]
MTSRTSDSELALPIGGEKKQVSTSSFLEDSENHEINILNTLILAAAHKKLAGQIILACALSSVILAFILPVYYTAETRILPPQQTQSIANSMLGQFGPLASLAGKDLGLKNPSDIYVALLQSRSIADSIIQRFNLLQVYGEGKISNAREKLADHSRISAGKDGVISVAVEDKISTRAAQIANAYIEELYKVNQRLAITEASQRRLFFANELVSAKNQLADAEVELKKTQENTGLIQLDAQAKAIIESLATLGAQIAAKEVQLRSMQSFATDQNPDYHRAKEELSALQSQLAKLQKSQSPGNGNIMVATAEVPKAGLEYLRKLRDVKYYETIYELIAKQYEIAKIDEAKSAPTVQVVDSAIEPDQRSRPKRLWVIASGFTLGLFLSIGWIFLREVGRQALDNVENQERLRTLRSHLST